MGVLRIFVVGVISCSILMGGCLVDNDEAVTGEDDVDEMGDTLLACGPVECTDIPLDGTTVNVKNATVEPVAAAILSQGTFNVSDIPGFFCPDQFEAFRIDACGCQRYYTDRSEGVARLMDGYEPGDDAVILLYAGGFVHRENICLRSDSAVGLAGILQLSAESLQTIDYEVVVDSHRVN